MPPVTLLEFEDRRHTPHYTNDETTARVENALAEIPIAELREHSGEVLAFYSDFEGVPYMYWNKKDHPDKTLLGGRTTIYLVNVVLRQREV